MTVWPASCSRLFVSHHWNPVRFTVFLASIYCYNICRYFAENITLPAYSKLPLLVATVQSATGNEKQCSSSFTLFSVTAFHKQLYACPPNAVSHSWGCGDEFDSPHRPFPNNWKSWKSRPLLHPPPSRHQKLKIGCIYAVPGESYSLGIALVLQP